MNITTSLGSFTKEQDEMAKKITEILLYNYPGFPIPESSSVNFKLSCETVNVLREAFLTILYKERPEKLNKEDVYYKVLAKITHGTYAELLIL